jgi:peptide/nickel transport system substrate-binding protein
MKRDLRLLAAVGSLSLALAATDAAFAKKAGGILKLGHFDSPASMSMLEESTQAVNRPMSGVFNNLVMFKQEVRQNSLRSIVPDLATSWSWNEEGTELTLPLRQGVKWHDGKPFTAADAKCTFDLLMDNAKEKLRINPRKSWYANVTEVTTNGDYEVTFHLKRPQPSFLALLATGWSPIYPCHVSPRDMRKHPIGTGPFKLADFKPNQSITVTRNPDYWKPGRPPSTLSPPPRVSSKIGPWRAPPAAAHQNTISRAASEDTVADHRGCAPLPCPLRGTCIG